MSFHLLNVGCAAICPVNNGLEGVKGAFDDGTERVVFASKTSFLQ